MFCGCHISIRHGYLRAALSARSLGMNAYQYFPKNPRSLQVKHFDERDARSCADYCRQHRIVSIAHTPYPTNLAQADSPLREVTVRSILNDLEIAEACGSLGVVIHFGKWKGSDLLEGYRYIIATLNQVQDAWSGQSLILLENQAGEGTNVGLMLEELVQIRNLTKKPEQIAFCFDTCHAFASGLWNGHNWSEIERSGVELNYFPYVKAIHLNDSRYPSGSQRDRHEKIGKGCIGTDHLLQFINSPYIKNIPIILETPAETIHAHLQEIAWIEANLS